MGMKFIRLDIFSKKYADNKYGIHSAVQIDHLVFVLLFVDASNQILNINV